MIFVCFHIIVICEDINLSLEIVYLRIKMQSLVDQNFVSQTINDIAKKYLVDKKYASQETPAWANEISLRSMNKLLEIYNNNIFIVNTTIVKSNSGYESSTIGFWDNAVDSATCITYNAGDFDCIIHVYAIRENDSSNVGRV